MNPDFYPIRTGWNEGLLMRRGKLTDKKIARYEKLGYYTDAFREFRREVMAKKQALRVKREGNFDVMPGGRMIYRP